MDPVLRNPGHPGGREKNKSPQNGRQEKLHIFGAFPVLSIENTSTNHFSFLSYEVYRFAEQVLEF